MSAKIKGIYKGLKFFTQIFVVKEREIQIGYPTDVKHVAHIGWDGSSGATAPSWMNEFKTTSNFSTTSLASSYGETQNCNLNIAASTWSSQDFDHGIGSQSVSQMLSSPTTDTNNIQKKHKRKNTKSSSSRYPRASFKPKSSHFEMVAAN